MMSLVGIAGQHKPVMWFEKRQQSHHFLVGCEYISEGSDELIIGTTQAGISSGGGDVFAGADAIAFVVGLESAAVEQKCKFSGSEMGIAAELRYGALMIEEGDDVAEIEEKRDWETGRLGDWETGRHGAVPLFRPMLSLSAYLFLVSQSPSLPVS